MKTKRRFPLLKSKLPKSYRTGALTEVSRLTSTGKELSATFSALIADAGGLDQMTIGSLMICERLSFLHMMLRQMERKIVDDPAKNQNLLGKWASAVNCLTGLIRTLGLDTKPTEESEVLSTLYREEQVQ
ncbi:MAG: hypothetical protein ACYC3X_18860 [Pirellulaceae bacterium]